MKLSLPVAGSVAAKASPLTALWTFPSVLFSAFLVAWGAEAAQFLVSQGLALAILAWLQTLPEFAVEAVIAWEAGKDPGRARSEEHTSELQSRENLVCRLLLEKKKKNTVLHSTAKEHRKVKTV